MIGQDFPWGGGGGGVFLIFLQEIKRSGTVANHKQDTSPERSGISVTRRIYQVQRLADELRGYRISLKAALIWQTRQSRLQQDASGVLQFNFKLDGRSLYYIFLYYLFATLHTCT